MNETIIISSAIIAITVVLVTLLIISSKNKRPSVSNANHHHSITASESINKREQGKYGSGCFVIVDENDKKIAESKEINLSQRNQLSLDKSEYAINYAKHLSSELFKGSIITPNKTIEVVFNADVKKGLSEGSYRLMRTKDGGVLADAVDNSTGRVVGKGRIVEAGKCAQIIAASYQLLSIAVAQSHLADINESLISIKDTLQLIIEKQENRDKANILGAIEYLRNVFDSINDMRSPDDVCRSKKNAIEDIIKNSYAWRITLEEDFYSLIKQIEGIQDVERLGTGKTYEKIRELANSATNLLNRRDIFLDLALSINFVTAYIDPLQIEFSTVEINDKQWVDLTNRYENAVNEKSDFFKSMFNSKEILRDRRENLRNIVTINNKRSAEQTRSYIQRDLSIRESISQFIDKNRNMHVAISFDKNGEVNGASLLK